MLYKHFAATQTFGSDSIDMRAEVGLLTRNVKYQGDPETSAKNQYGAHIMIHYPEDESCIGRILYTEFYNVGQAFKLGRYPIHFHVIGTVAKSLVKGNSIHQTYNRAITIHAVTYFNIVNNVIYNTMGHSIFVEDAIETKNIVHHNLVIGTRRSWSLLNTDQTPASFWITHPDNVFISNHAAGADRYGFWYDTQEHPINGSFTPSICPVNERLGEFRDNVAHSNGRYGLRLFHKMVPRERPCDPWTYDASDPTAVGYPYPSNPAVPAKFYNFISWKNEVGAICEEVGAVEWHNFKVSDNLNAGMEWSFANNQVLAKDIMLINGGLVIGKSDNSESILDNANVRGIIGPRWDFFTIKGVKFFKLNFGTSAALGDCSHCFHPNATDSGARTYFVSGLVFDSTVSKRIGYQFPLRGIFADLDGSLTGKGPNSWATAYWKHNEQPECTVNLEVYDGITCDSTVQVRRIAFFNMVPTAQFANMNLKIAKADDSELAKLTLTDKTTYLNTASNYSSLPMKDALSPSSAWTVPYVTGHKYRIFWDKGQLNYSTMRIEVSPNWKTTDKSLLFNLPYTNNYENIDFYGRYGAVYATESAKTTGSLLYADGTLNTVLPAQWISGYSAINKDKKEIDFVINGAAGSSKTIES